MKVQWSLRTLMFVMTLGGPLLAASVKLVTDHHAISWDAAIRDAQKVGPLPGGFQTVDKRQEPANAADRYETE